MNEERICYQKTSNNPRNFNKNICALHVAQALNVENKARYLHTILDIVRASRTAYIVRNRMTKIGKAFTVNKLCKKLNFMSANESGSVIGYLIRVKNGKFGHVILLNNVGRKIVDTDNRVFDRRILTHCYIIKKKINE